MRWKSVLEIDLNTIKENYNKLKQLCSSEVSAALKANAYGLGATQIASTLVNEGCKKFFLANIKEAHLVRQINKDIEVFVLDGAYESEEQYLIDNKLIPVHSDISQIRDFNSFCKARNITYSVALHIETGMNRFGIVINNPNEFYQEMQKYSNLDFRYLISHLASSEESDNEFNKTQLKRFKDVSRYFKNTRLSIANSGGILLGNEYHLDFVRPGAAIYGINVRKDMRFFSNPIRLFSYLIQIKEVQQGEGVGYNQKYIAKENHLVGTIPIGYADGISRSLSNNGKCYIMGYEAEIIGRISMDLININLKNIPKEYLYIGQEVDIINQIQTPDIIAEGIGTIGYEVLTSLGDRYERRYIR